MRLTLEVSENMQKVMIMTSRNLRPLFGARPLSLIFAALLFFTPLPTRAMREFARGNSPVLEEPGWPEGTTGLADLSTRVGYSHASNTFVRGFIVSGGSTDFVYR